ncbi:MAG: sulfotransferase family 2 domain-containing protein [Actinobacteria bacterium]|jgi:hypothetical protein|nr:sulfotransferase family 2 domain-containing protein [Actinomycetota bacterium]MBU1494220.1 sulfotransferase family 2 domain-containing protein [Actinomycetota bacterium]MBU1866374.1 sulfotransferase family 2 domain-containing protein [Actinomycetota bacterium]
MTAGPLYVFVHLFKTGGTTINGHLARHLSWDEEFVHLGPWGDRVRARDGQPDPADWPPERWDRTRVIAGHRVDRSIERFVAGREVRYLTVSRDPADLAVSRYNFHSSREGDRATFWEWYETQPRNPSSKRLRKALHAESLSELRDTLNSFWFVGVTEHLDDDLPHLFAAIGVPTDWVNRRVTGGERDLEDLDLGRETFSIRRHTVLTDEMRARIHAENSGDLRLYRYAIKRRRECRREHGWD